MKLTKEQMKRWFEPFFVFIVIFLAGFIHYLVPYKMAFLNFYAIPVLMAAYYLNIRKTLLGAAACIMLTWINVQMAPRYFLMKPDYTALYISLFTWSSFLLLAAILVDSLKRHLLEEVEHGKDLDRKIVELIKEEKRKMEIVFQKMKEGAILTDKDGEIKLLNRSAEVYLERDKYRFSNVKTAFQDFFIKPGVEPIMQSQETVARFEVFREKPKKFYLDGAAIKLFKEEKDGSSVQEGWLWVISDVTAQRMEETLARNFLSLISHKLNTPLAAVNGYAQTLKNEALAKNLPESVQKFSSTILTQGLKLKSLVEGLLDFVTIENADETTLVRSSFDAQDLIKETTELARRSFKDVEGVTVRIETAGKVAVNADKNLIKGALKCLMVNAVKFNPGKEKLVTVSARAVDGNAVITVEDNGPGIPGEEQDNIFNKFYQVEASFTGQVEGWGLGLALAKKAVEIHRGSISVKSILQKGSVFTLSLPMAAPEAIAAHSPAKETTTSGT